MMYIHVYTYIAMYSASAASSVSVGRYEVDESIGRDDECIPLL
jgi:hypothetical protein